MNNVMICLELTLLAVGAFFLIRSLRPINQLILDLTDQKLIRQWKTLSVLILSFLIGYLVLGYDLWVHKDTSSFISVMIALVLFLGGTFAFLVGQLALYTANDMKHLALLQQESITDGLTRLKNRRYFDQRLSEEVALSKRYKLPLSLILVDVDYFKKINDVFGHTVGDEVLKNLSNIIMETVRDSDVVARYGGEEIVIITPNTDKKEASLLAERLREKVEKTVMATVETTQEVVQATISLGVCALSHVILDKEALLEETDQALYLAKKYGRNRVSISSW
ncbi:GGDEF domain-containing protein [Sulfurospirillum sp. hDNRA2]|jgi:diguanylate cyclase (GGDEF)-like protein|uniref:GGDEF domain-containing protein n=1 Tax=Sulfurospirillum sp. hDNRA2 TaxID=3237298 RepID=UPI0020B80B4D|nr:GGDEF domain-containing protein [Sulfurospirillum sp. DNRA8]MCP3651805.1 GGDEF domain-containing protein [Sulfurospirillum sp. DNRA8]MCR1810652.1 GGDEF domain-containing protein [Sulfurospirillum sp. DNRA8]